MGQRSQIYARINGENGKKFLVPRYYQWNYGTRMISRARSIIEWLQKYESYPYFLTLDNEYTEKLRRIMDINFDYHDIVLGQDIIEEYKEFGDGDFNSFAFQEQDNNDGRLLIDMIVDYDKRTLNGEYKVKYKYAFLPCNLDNAKPMTGLEYMDWESESLIDDWRECYKEEVKCTERNIRYIEKHAELMTEEEVNEYINYPYEDEMKLKPLPF